MPDSGSVRRLYVRRLKHVKAATLAATLQSLFGGRGAQALGMGGSGRPGSTLSQQLRQQQVPPVRPGAEPNVQITTGNASVALPGDLAGPVQIVPDETTNSLLVRAEPADWTVVERAIESLDLRPLQVLIEMVIAEVRKTTNLDLGVSASADNTKSKGTSGTVTLNGPTTGDFVLRVMRTGSTNVSALLTALSSEGEVRIVSRPVILAQNNQQAHILIGDERPFIQVSRTLPTDQAVQDQVVQYRDVGTQLTIVPTINTDGYVNLELTQEVSNATNEQEYGAPVISTREASTQLFVRTGHTVVIGGLIDHQRTTSKSGIPVLKDIPLLGHLFSSTTSATEENELFLLLTPHIIQTDEESDSLRRELSGKAKLIPLDTLDLGVLRDTIPTIH